MPTEKHINGPHAGKTSLREMIRSVAPGECVIFQLGEVNPEYASVACSKESKASGAHYTVSSRKELDGRVVICRLPENQ